MKKSGGVNIGRLDGVMYYKMTSDNLFNFIKQRKDREMALIKRMPNFLSESLTVPLNQYLNRINKKILKNSDAIIFQSKLSKNMHEKFIGRAKKRSTIILNGVPTNVFNPNVKKITLEGFPKLVITASFRLHKRLQDAIFVANLMSGKYPNIKLHIIGDIDKFTKKYIDRLDLSNCVFHGKLESRYLPSIYNSCDIGLSPSIFDPCPNSVVEMMGCGLPVISVKESGASELIGCSDLLIKEGLSLNFYELQTINKLPVVDGDKWIELIEKVLENKIFYSEAMLKRVEENLDIGIIAKKYADFIIETYNTKSEQRDGFI